VETRLGGVETRLDGMDGRLTKLEAGQARIEAEQGAMRRDIGLQIERVLNKQAEFSDDLSVVMARLTRVDHTTRAAVDEVRAMHSQHTRLAARVTAIEKRDETPD
jgi:hypothetical protein